MIYQLVSNGKVILPAAFLRSAALVWYLTSRVREVFVVKRKCFYLFENLSADTHKPYTSLTIFLAHVVIRLTFNDSMEALGKTLIFSF